MPRNLDRKARTGKVEYVNRGILIVSKVKEIVWNGKRKMKVTET